MIQAHKKFNSNYIVTISTYLGVLILMMIAGVFNKTIQEIIYHVGPLSFVWILFLIHFHDSLCLTSEKLIVYNQWKLWRRKREFKWEAIKTISIKRTDPYNIYLYILIENDYERVNVTYVRKIDEFLLLIDYNNIPFETNFSEKWKTRWEKKKRGKKQ